VIVGPPDFAPATTNLVTLYDIAIEAAVARGWMQPPERPSFTEHIYPIFARVALLQWVQQRTLDGHGPDAHGIPRQSIGRRHAAAVEWRAADRRD
jgi:hypothetical protein